MGYNPNSQGSSFKGSSRSLSTGYQNGTFSTIPISTPVSVNSFGQVAPLDVSSESSVESMVGLTATAVPSTAYGQVVSQGRLENAQTGFAVGSPLWAGPSGGLTNIPPDLNAVGWASGMWVIFIGIVVKNEFDSGLQDIQLFKEIIGQL